jgi:uncharacterized protein (DUF362 family)
MASRVTLRKDTLSALLSKHVYDYYKTMDVAPEYVASRLKRWQDASSGCVTYAAMQGREIVGWIVYSPSTSTIEEILTDAAAKRSGLEAEMVDALIAKETMVAAEILAADRERYRWMVAYGFRPTRSFMSQGFSFLKMDLSTSVLFEKLAGRGPARVYRKKEDVAIAQVLPPHTPQAIGQGLDQLIDRLGGLQKFVKKGQTVVIKPNLVADHGLMNGVYKAGVVTDIRIVQALIERLLPMAGKVIIAEGSSINRSATMKMFTLYGYDKLVDLDPAKVSIVDLNTDDAVEKAVPRGKRMLSRRVPVTLERADVIINVPVMKVHFAAIVSLAVKSLQGAMPPLEKYMTHFFGLWQNLVNIHHLVKPKLHIIDGLIGQEDFGPVSGTEKPMNLLIGGTNPVAVDAVTMRIMGLDPLTSPPVHLAYLQGLGPIAPEKIRVLGPSVEEVRSLFKQPEINLTSGRDFIIHADRACPGCRGYLHFALAKLRRPDPADPSRLLMDRPFDRPVHLYLGPATEAEINPNNRNVFLGICQQHHAEQGTYLPGCPPHAEVLINGTFSLFPDVERPKYADKTEEAKLEEMLKQVLASLQ